MTVMLLQLSLLVVTVIQLTSSQPTYDVFQQDSNVNSCGRTEQVLSQLMMAVSQLQSGMSQLQKDVKTVIGNVSELQSGTTQLQGDVKTVIGNVSQLQSGMSQLQADVTTVIRNVSQLQSGMSQLQDDVKAVIKNKETNATTKGTLRNLNNQSHRQAASVAC